VLGGAGEVPAPRTRSADATALTRDERDAALTEELPEAVHELADGVLEHGEALRGALLEEDVGGAYGDKFHDEECVGAGDDSTCSKQRRLEGSRGGGMARHVWRARGVAHVRPHSLRCGEKILTCILVTYEL
jgi:hypothetical protein